MELFKRKESCKEKFDSNNNWKAAWPRMILERHLFDNLKYVENEISNSTSHQKKKRDRVEQ